MRIRFYFLIRKTDDRFGQPDVFEYFRCDDCDCVFLKNKIEKESLASLYEKYYSKDKKVNLKSNVLKRILKFFKIDRFLLQSLAGNIILLYRTRNNSRVLEIGSAYSAELNKITEKKNLDWTGLEVDRSLVKKILNDGFNAIHGTIDSIENETQEKFDYIVLSQSLEHQYDINKFFENSKKILKRGGRIIFTTPNFDSRYRLKF